MILIMLFYHWKSFSSKSTTGFLRIGENKLRCRLRNAHIVSTDSELNAPPRESHVLHLRSLVLTTTTKSTCFDRSIISFVNTKTNIIVDILQSIEWPSHNLIVLILNSFGPFSILKRINFLFDFNKIILKFQTNKNAQMFPLNEIDKMNVCRF